MSSNQRNAKKNCQLSTGATSLRHSTKTSPAPGDYAATAQTASILQN